MSFQKTTELIIETNEIDQYVSLTLRIILNSV
jgi:hypothetical protein